MDKTALGDRMKFYEASNKVKLNTDEPILLRIDGKAFSKFTKNLPKPYDPVLINIMQVATIRTCAEIQQCLFAYSQSDEISILLNGWNRLNSEVWFGGSKSKIESVAASIYTAKFAEVSSAFDRPFGFFDARAWNVPDIEEVQNYFIWRQQDAKRNSISSYTREYYSHKECDGKSIDDRLQMLRDNGIVWDNLPSNLKWGFTAFRATFDRNGAARSEWRADLNSPYFVTNKDYFQKRIWSQMETDNE